MANCLVELQIRIVNVLIFAIIKLKIQNYAQTIVNSCFFHQPDDFIF